MKCQSIVISEELQEQPAEFEGILACVCNFFLEEILMGLACVAVKWLVIKV